MQASWARPDGDRGFIATVLCYRVLNRYKLRRIYRKGARALLFIGCLSCDETRRRSDSSSRLSGPSAAKKSALSPVFGHAGSTGVTGRATNRYTGYTVARFAGLGTPQRRFSLTQVQGRTLRSDAVGVLHVPADVAPHEQRTGQYIHYYQLEG